jgi:hypothetical protein
MVEEIEAFNLGNSKKKKGFLVEGGGGANAYCDPE